MTFYLKYRPQKIEDIDSDNVRETLKKIVSLREIPRAFLFSGPKGIGKTSVARILAKVVNCESTSAKLRGPGKFEPCNQCKQCISISRGENLDVIELDAASHRGIDDIRQIRESVKLSPAKANKKVYIIDEAHMLTLEASNALLKTLEEPPPHVIFILATTNPEKLIETIRSRTTNIVFKKASSGEIIRALKRIAKAEDLKIQDDALELFAKASDGSFRDAVKTLEQIVSTGGGFSKDEVESFLFDLKLFDVNEFLRNLANRQTQEALELLEAAIQKAASVKNIATSIIERLRLSLLAKVGLEGEDLEFFEKRDLVYLIKLFSEAAGKIPTSVIEQIPLELAIIEWGDEKALSSKLKAQNDGDQVEEKRTETEEVGSKRTTEGKKASGASSTNGLTEEIWTQVLTMIRPKNTSTEALLRAARPLAFDGDNLTLGVYYKFHKERLEASPHRDILEETITNLLGNKIRVICSLTEPPPINKINKENLLDAPKDEVVLEKQDTVLTDTKDEDIIKVAKEIFGS